MQSLIIVRHGDYNEKTGRLTEAGVAQAEALAGKLAVVAAGRTVRLLSSPAYRTRETADILVKHMPTEVQEKWDLAGSVRDQEERARILALIAEAGAQSDVLVIVTHAHIAAHLPPHLSPAPDKRFAELELQRAQARVLDLVTGESRVI